MHAIDQILAAIQRTKTLHRRPIVVALDGGSGAGKTTVACLVQQLTDAALVHLDDFYNTNVPRDQWSQRSVTQRLRDVFDWERLRRHALDPLRAGQSGRWYAFDFVSGLGPNGTYGLQSEVTEVAPAAVILLEGAYSASPQLTDLIDLAVLIEVPAAERHRRTALREDARFLERWHAIWDEVEAYYFTLVRPRASFDLVVMNEFSGPHIYEA